MICNNRHNGYDFHYPFCVFNSLVEVFSGVSFPGFEGFFDHCQM